MSKKKVCRDCKIFFEENACPLCKKDRLANSWQGRVTIIDQEKSVIAQKMGITHVGEYAIKIR